MPAAPLAPGGSDPAGPVDGSVGGNERTIRIAARAVPDDADAHAQHGLVGCPSCGALNSPQRDRCGRCRADLATGEVYRGGRQVTVSADPDEDTGPLGVQAGRRWLRWVIVGLGLVIGAVIGALAVAEVGPFAGGGQPAAVASFDPAAYPAQPRPLEVARVLASSTHDPQGDSRYDASLMVDGELTTAWNSVGAARPDGIGETLRFVFDRPAWVASLVIANGYQKDDRSFVANGRIRRARVVLGDDVVFDVTVGDRPGRQVVQLPEPVLTDRLTVNVVESYAGDTYEDLAVSEVEPRGWPATPEDAALLPSTDGG